MKKYVLFMLLFLQVVSCNPVEDVEFDEISDNGVSDAEIHIGSSLALKGHAGFLGRETLRGAMSYIKSVNEAGGVHGRRVRVTAYDDGYDPPRCLANTQKLLVKDDVFALFCYVGTPTTVKILPLVEQAGIPLVGMFTGANALREPFNRYLFNVRASYYEETGAAVWHMVHDLGMRRIAVFYQYDAYGFDGLTGAELALQEEGLAPVARGSYIRGTVDIGEGVDRITASRAEAVIMIGTSGPCAAFIRACRDRGFDPLFYTVSFVGAEELARMLGKETDPSLVIMSQVVPPPEGPRTRELMACAREYVSLLDRYYPGQEPNAIGLEGYLNARVLVAGLRRAGRDLTRDTFLNALESMGPLSLGGSSQITFGPTDHQGMDQVYFSKLKDGAFVLVDDWSSIPGALRQGGGRR
jgi:ABC-type branched-subunit amino acid transport system substrate-binding protein